MIISIKEIISNLLSRVVVVDDMDCAIGIAKRYNNRFKIVALDGQVMNPGGSMSGGSAAKGAGILSRANTIEELNTQAKKLSQEAEEIAAEFKWLLLKKQIMLLQDFRLLRQSLDS